MDMHTAIVLLTIAVGLLTIVIVAILALAIVLLLKISKLIKNMNRIGDNVVAVTSWMTPTRLLGAVFRALRKR